MDILLKWLVTAITPFGKHFKNISQDHKNVRMFFFSPVTPFLGIYLKVVHEMRGKNLVSSVFLGEAGVGGVTLEYYVAIKSG